MRRKAEEGGLSISEKGAAGIGEREPRTAFGLRHAKVGQGQHTDVLEVKFMKRIAY
jgi:hypothetical protein